MIARGTLQAATAIAKTTQTLIGAVIDTDGYNYITLFFDYAKGDETGLLIQAHVLNTAAGTAYQQVDWANSGGTYSATAKQFTATANANLYAIFDVRGIQFIKFTQGGSNNDGTPTGTLAATYTMKS